MSDFGLGPNTCSVAEQRQQAEKELAKLKKQGRQVAPVTSKVARSPRASGAQSWCSNLERYSDFASRLPRGRSYVRNGLVVDLQIAKGKVTANGQRLRALRCCDHHCAGRCKALASHLQ